MSRYPLLDLGFGNALMDGANLGLRAVALQDQRRQAERQAELERQSLGIQQGNLDARVAEQDLRRREYDDRQGQQQATADANTAALTGAGSLMRDASGVDGPPIPPAMINARIADLLQRTAAADPDVRRHLMGIGAQAQTQVRDDQQLAGFYQWLDGLEGANDGVRRIKPQQAAYLRAQAPTLLELNKDPYAAAAELDQERLLADVLKQQVGPDPILHAAIDNLAQTPGGISKAPASIFAGLVKTRQEQMKAQQDAAARDAMIKQNASDLQVVSPGARPDAAAAAARLRANDIPIGVGDANLSGRTRRERVDPDLLRAANMRVEMAQQRLRDVIEIAANGDVPTRPGMRGFVQYSEARRDLEAARRRYIELADPDNKLGPPTGDHGNTNPPAEPNQPDSPRAATPPVPDQSQAIVTPQHMQQASEDLGPDADLNEIIKRARQLAGQSVNP